MTKKSYFLGGFDDVTREMDDFIKEFSVFFEPCCKTPYKYSPKVNMVKSDDELTMKIELPGFGKEDLDLSIIKNVLEVRSLKEKKEKKILASIIIPQKRNYLFNEVTAEAKNGILTVKIPYDKEKEAGVKIKLS
jgi:HSP20 family protein